MPLLNFFTVCSPREFIVFIAVLYTVSQKSGTAKMCVTPWRFTVLTIVSGDISFSCTNVREKNANHIYIATSPKMW